MSSPDPSPLPRRRFCIRTFGCKSNQYESQGIREALCAAGWTEADAPESADALVVNSCCVTGRAEATCRNAIRALRRAQPEATLLLTGCAVDADCEWTGTLSAIDQRVPNTAKHRIPQLLDAAPGGGSSAPEGETPSAGAEASGLRDPRFAFSLTSFAGRTRAYVKIQDGCAGGCAYCIIPAVRGRPASRPAGAILDEARSLTEQGYRELVLTGINIGAWTAEGMRLDELIVRLGAVPGLARLRLGSLEPPFVTEALLRAVRDTPAACPHLHIPIQHADDAVLAGMNRGYGVEALRERIRTVRETLARPAITTDVIVGFPTETPESFASLLAFARETGFARMHVFRYSPRPGTPAARLTPAATEREVSDRVRRMRESAEGLSASYAAGFVGEVVRVLIERSSGGQAEGHTERYVPVRLSTAMRPRAGEIRSVRALCAAGERLEGVPVTSAHPESA